MALDLAFWVIQGVLLTPVLFLAAFVREAKLGRGALQDDLGPAAAAKSRRRYWLAAAGALLIVIGVLGAVRTSTAMDAQAPAGVARYIPGLIANPAKYVSAVNGASSTPSLEAVGVMEQKQAMDRWEALALIGLAAFVFAALSFFELP